MHRLLVLGTLCLLLRHGCLAAASETSYWRLIPFQNVTAFQAAVPARSRVGCFQKCGEYSHCSRVAFQQSTRSCYLLPDYEAQTGNVDDDVVVYEKEDALCSPGDAPISYAEVDWQHSLTSLEGDVTCHADYVADQKDVTVKCDASNAWTVDGNCLQKRWIDPDTQTGKKYSIPLTPSVGWKMCLKGTPVANATTIIIQSYTPDGDRPLKAMFNVAEKNARFLSVIGGVHSPSQIVTFPPLPMKEFRPFEMEISASSNSTLDIQLDGNLYGTYRLPLNVTQLFRVRVTGDLDAQELDLWCHVN